MPVYDGYWEMNEGGPYDNSESANDIFKCTDCGAETHPAAGFNGAPNPALCKRGCKNREFQGKSRSGNPRYRQNFDLIFPEAKSAGF